MSSHFAVLPTDVLQLLCSGIGTTADSSTHSNLNFLRLPHPRTRIPCLFLPFRRDFDSVTTILEVQATAPPDERSWINGQEVVADGRMLMMTPIDPAFLLYPLLDHGKTTTQFRTLDDIVESTIDSFKDSAEKPSGKQQESSTVRQEDVARFLNLDCIPRALSRLCEAKEINSDIMVYCYSSSKFTEYLRLKVNHICQTPAFAASKTTTRSLAKDGLMDDGKDSLLKLAQIRAACDMISQYLPTEAKETLLALYDFKELDKYLDLNKQDTMNAAGAASGKKGKAADEENKQTAGDKRKKAAKASVGVEKLKKANTTGMAKLSTFFNKKAT